jgi:hypothetical protein
MNYLILKALIFTSFLNTFHKDVYSNLNLKERPEDDYWEDLPELAKYDTDTYSLEDWTETIQNLFSSFFQEILEQIFSPEKNPLFLNYLLRDNKILENTIRNFGIDPDEHFDLKKKLTPKTIKKIKKQLIKYHESSSNEDKLRYSFLIGACCVLSERLLQSSSLEDFDQIFKLLPDSSFFNAFESKFHPADRYINRFRFVLEVLIEIRLGAHSNYQNHVLNKRPLVEHLWRKNPNWNSLDTFLKQTESLMHKMFEVSYEENRDLPKNPEFFYNLSEKNQLLKDKIFQYLKEQFHDDVWRFIPVQEYIQAVLQQWIKSKIDTNERKYKRSHSPSNLQRVEFIQTRKYWQFIAESVTREF